MYGSRSDTDKRTKKIENDFFHTLILPCRIFLVEKWD